MSRYKSKEEPGYDYNYRCPKCQKIISFTLYKNTKVPSIMVSLLREDVIYSKEIICDCGTKMVRSVHKQKWNEFREL